MSAQVAPQAAPEPPHTTADELLERAARLRHGAAYAESGASATEDTDKARTLEDLAGRMLTGEAEAVHCPKCGRESYSVRSGGTWQLRDPGRWLEPHAEWLCNLRASR